MGHHYLMQFLLLSILGTIIQNGNCQFKSFKEIELELFPLFKSEIWAAKRLPIPALAEQRTLAVK